MSLLRNRCATLAISSLLIGSLPVAAQEFTRYVPPASLAFRPIPAREVVKSNAEAARWTLGTLRISPRASIRNVAYSNNVYDSSLDEDRVSDLTATAGAGLNLYQNLGEKALLNGFAQYDYVWWRSESDLAGPRISYGLRLFGFFNRLNLEAVAGRVERQDILSSEAVVPVDTSDDRVGLRFDLDIGHPWVIFGRVDTGRLRHSGAAEDRVPGLGLSELDRDSTQANLGIEYALSNGLKLGLGYEITESDFLEDEAGRSNTSSGPMVRIDFIGNRLDLDLWVVFRSLEFDGDISGSDRRETTGNLRLGWNFGEKTRTSIYTGRRIIPSAFENDTFFLGERLGVAVDYSFTEKLRLSGYLEDGKDSFERVSGESADRVDDLSALGISLLYELIKSLDLQLGLRRTERDSSIDELDSDSTAVLFSVRSRGSVLAW